jgi:hypothetical protein
MAGHPDTIILTERVEGIESASSFFPLFTMSAEKFDHDTTFDDDVGSADADLHQPTSPKTPGVLTVEGFQNEGPVQYGISAGEDMQQLFTDLFKGKKKPSPQDGALCELYNLLRAAIHKGNAQVGEVARINAVYATCLARKQIDDLLAALAGD